MTLRLVVIAVVPAMGLAMFASDETIGRRQAADVAQAIEDESVPVRTLVSLRFALAKEQIPAIALTFGRSYGLSFRNSEQILLAADPDTATGLGEALWDEFRSAQATTDQLLLELGDDPRFVELEGLVAELHVAVSDVPLNDFDGDLIVLYRKVLGPLDALINELFTETRDQFDSSLDTNELRAALNQMLAAHRPAGPSPSSSLLLLGAGPGTLRRARAGAQPAGRGPSGLRVPGVRVRPDPDRTHRGGLGPDAIERSGPRFDEAAQSAINGKSIDLTTDLAQVTAVTQSGLITLEDHGRLLEAATADVGEAALDTRIQALESFTDAMVLLMVVLAFSLAVVYYVGRSISRPMQKLSAYAERLSAGDVHASFPKGSRGPTEVETLGLAFADVVANLRAIDAHSWRWPPGSSTTRS
ncbi:MAG: HAMP domain-containing protein [Ilumatobacteraceae bacterium]